jgi:hypothetical protein
MLIIGVNKGSISHDSVLITLEIQHFSLHLQGLRKRSFSIF